MSIYTKLLFDDDIITTASSKLIMINAPARNYGSNYKKRPHNVKNSRYLADSVTVDNTVYNYSTYINLIDEYGIAEISGKNIDFNLPPSAVTNFDNYWLNVPLPSGNITTGMLSSLILSSYNDPICGLNNEPWLSELSTLSANNPNQRYSRFTGSTELIRNNGSYSKAGNFVEGYLKISIERVENDAGKTYNFPYPSKIKLIIDSIPVNQDNVKVKNDGTGKYYYDSSYLLNKGYTTNYDIRGMLLNINFYDTKIIVPKNRNTEIM